MRYTADFETTTDPNDCRVWAWGLCDIDNPDAFTCGNDLDSFFAQFENRSATVLFHNLKFDGWFILYWLFRNGFTYAASKAETDSRTFSTLISDLGAWYSIRICFRKHPRKSVYLTIHDSLKVLPFKVSTIAKAFKLPISKLEIDYNAPRPVGHVLTDQEREYLRNDVTIVAKALAILYAQEMEAMTTGSNALRDFKRIYTDRQFDYSFPKPYYDADVRQAYRGGFTYLRPKYRGRTVKSGIVLDVNSLYPFVMYSRPMPHGEGIWFDGQYRSDPLYPLHVQQLSCSFRIKPGHIPTIQIKHDYRFSPIEYIESTAGDEVTLTLTSVDLALFFEHYDVSGITWHSGWKFKAASGIFCEYIDKWSGIKVAAKLEGNGGMYTLAKLMLNSLYGKFALNPRVSSKLPIYDGERVRLTLGPEESRDPIYIPVGVFITSYAREITIRAAQSVYDRFIYADTDSLHLLGTELPTGLEIDAAKLGAWKHELTFSRAKYLRAKTYIEYGREPGSDEPERLKVTCAGLPDACHSQVTFRNFKLGAVYRGKLRPRQVPGGIVLEDSEFSVKDNGLSF